MIDLAQFEQYLILHYKNPNTREQYFKIAQRYNKQGLDLDQNGVNNYLKFYTNNLLNRSALKALKVCFNATFDVPKQLSRELKKIEAKYLEKADIDELITRSEPKISLMVRIFFETGLRLSELLNIKREDIDLEKRALRGIGKGNVEFNEKFSITTKEKLVEYLNFNAAEYPFQYAGVTAQKQKAIYEIKKAAKRIGFAGKHIHPHLFRHSIAHHLRAEKGFDLEQIRIKLRHSKLETVKIYATGTQKEVDKKMEEEVFADDKNKKIEEIEDVLIDNFKI